MEASVPAVSPLAADRSHAGLTRTRRCLTGHPPTCQAPLKSFLTFARLLVSNLPRWSCKSASRRMTMRRDVLQTNRASRLIVGAVLTALLALTLPQSHAQSTAGPIPTQPNLKVLFICGILKRPELLRVRKLIKLECTLTDLEPA